MSKDTEKAITGANGLRRENKQLICDQSRVIPVLFGQKLCLGLLVQQVFSFSKRSVLCALAMGINRINKRNPLKLQGRE
jgi:hypothetical protein